MWHTAAKVFKLQNCSDIGLLDFFNLQFFFKISGNTAKVLWQYCQGTLAVIIIFKKLWLLETFASQSIFHIFSDEYLQTQVLVPNRNDAHDCSKPLRLAQRSHTGNQVKL